ncbi:MAG TPA: C1 family peptidase [Gemmataceae bacterium]|jgi:C1A family cysteine protease
MLKDLPRVQAQLDGRVDLREWFPPVDDPDGLRSCVAHACVGLVQYFERRSSGRVVRTLPRLLYQMSRRLLHWSGDCGTQCRPTLKALVRFGLPPEKYCDTATEQFDTAPEAFLFCYAAPYQSIRYLRLDTSGADGAATLARMRAHLAAGFPCLFGFPLCSALSDAAEIPFPTAFDQACGGIAAVAVGYDDDRRIRSTRGALLIRSSWGEGWGERGYGWLPYAYVEKRLAVDFWTLLKPEWLASQEFLDPMPE